MKKLILTLTFIIWFLIHIYLMQLNEILKVADSFAYLQMSHYLKNFSLDWFWTGWFGFLYSLPIAIIDFFLNNDFLSAQIINIILFNVWWILLYKIWKYYLNFNYNILLIILYFLSPILLHFNIHVLSENIYIPLFLWLVLFLHKFYKKPNYKNTIILSLFIALLYLTRAEAFIYIWALLLIIWILLLKKKIKLKKAFSLSTILVLWFFVFIFPYLAYLNSFTWEWWLTNKWSSNLRQAQMRWVEVMDDDGFEKAVWELTSNNHHLIAWFAWGLKYDKPSIEWWIKSYILENPKEVFFRWLNNQKKLYTRVLPEIILWDWLKAFWNEKNIFYKNSLFLILLLLPLIFFIYWVYKLIENKKEKLLILSLPFFFVASIFFTIFFMLNRYFLIFLPIILIVIVYWIQEYKIKKLNYYLKVLLSFLIIWIYIIWLNHYYIENKNKDNYFSIKQEAWNWIRENIDSHIKQEYDKWNLRVAERWPIVTYYSWTKQRWLTPYTYNLEDLKEYLTYNKIDFLVVDTLDFKKYRPLLKELLDENREFNWFERIKTFKKEEEKVILYKIKNEN